MIIYIVGASGSGKTTLLKKVPIPGYDLDDIYETNWNKHRKWETVQKGAKKDIETLTKKHKDIVFVGLQFNKDLAFSPDVVYILIRTDYEKFYRDKLVRDLNLLCDNKKEYERVLSKEPVNEIKKHFGFNDIVNMKSFDDFKLDVEKTNKDIQKEFPKAETFTADKLLIKLKTTL